MKKDTEKHVVYFMRAADAVKIGITSNDIKSRMDSIQTGCAHVLSLLGVIACATREESEALEQHLHREFDDIRMSGEWFNIAIDPAVAATNRSERRITLTEFLRERVDLTPFGVRHVFLREMAMRFPGSVISSDRHDLWWPLSDYKLRMVHGCISVRDYGGHSQLPRIHIRPSNNALPPFEVERYFGKRAYYGASALRNSIDWSAEITTTDRELALFSDAVTGLIHARELPYDEMPDAPVQMFEAAAWSAWPKSFSNFYTWTTAAWWLYEGLNAARGALR